MADEGLVIRKVPDTSGSERVIRFDPETGARKLVNPATEGEDHEPWPLAGVQIANEKLPKHAMLSTSYVAVAKSEGWIETVGDKVVHFPGGPAENPWGVTHTVVQCDAVVIKTLDGDVRYRVRNQPGKFTSNGDEATEEHAGDPDTEVRWYYDLELDNG